MIPIRQISATHLEFQTSDRFTIRKLQDIVGDNGLVHNLHRHDFFFILALQNGEGIHEIDFTPYKVTGNSIYFLRPGQVHKLALQSGCTGFLVEYNAEFYQPTTKLAILRTRKASNKTYCKLESEKFSKLYANLAAMFLEYTNQEEGYKEMIIANLDIFFIEFVRQCQTVKDSVIVTSLYTQERLEELFELIETHIASHKLASQYANLMSLSLFST